MADTPKYYEVYAGIRQDPVATDEHSGAKRKVKDSKGADFSDDWDSDALNSSKTDYRKQTRGIQTEEQNSPYAYDKEWPHLTSDRVDKPLRKQKEKSLLPKSDKRKVTQGTQTKGRSHKSPIDQEWAHLTDRVVDPKQGSFTSDTEYETPKPSSSSYKKRKSTQRPGSRVRSAASERSVPPKTTSILRKPPKSTRGRTGSPSSWGTDYSSDDENYRYAEDQFSRSRQSQKGRSKTVHFRDFSDSEDGRSQRGKPPKQQRKKISTLPPSLEYGVQPGEKSKREMRMEAFYNSFPSREYESTRGQLGPRQFTSLEQLMLNMDDKRYNTNRDYSTYAQPYSRQHSTNLYQYGTGTRTPSTFVASPYGQRAYSQRPGPITYDDYSMRGMSNQSTTWPRNVSFNQFGTRSTSTSPIYGQSSSSTMGDRSPKNIRQKQRGRMDHQGMRQNTLGSEQQQGNQSMWYLVWTQRPPIKQDRLLDFFYFDNNNPNL